jgi:hypothetical protein
MHGELSFSLLKNKKQTFVSVIKMLVYSFQIKKKNSLSLLKDR